MNLDEIKKILEEELDKRFLTLRQELRQDIADAVSPLLQIPRQRVALADQDPGRGPIYMDRAEFNDQGALERRLGEVIDNAPPEE